MTDNVLASTTLTVDCATPVAKASTTLNASGHSHPSYNNVWACSFTNRSPQLEISLMWTCPASDVTYFQPYNIQSLRIISRDGALVYSAPVNGVTTSAPLTASVSMASVQVKHRLQFDIVFSTCASVNVPLKVPKSKPFASSLLKDIATMNMAFTFGFNGSARNVALWAHQSILSQQPKLATLMSKLPNAENDPKVPEAVSGVKTTHVTESSLEAYCAMIRYLYTSVIKLEVDLNDFAIGCPPDKPYSASCKKLPSVDGLFTSTGPPSLTKSSIWNLTRTTTWNELFAVADCYDVKDLRQYCRDRIMESITVENALQTLFDFAYKFKDMKETLLEFVAKNMEKLFGEDRDPFETYKDHPERYALLVKALQLKYKASY